MITVVLPAACVVHVDAACCMLLHFRLQEARRANAAAKALKHGDVTGGSRLYDNDSKSCIWPQQKTPGSVKLTSRGCPAKRALSYAWRVGSFWQDTIDLTLCMLNLFFKHQNLFVFYIIYSTAPCGSKDLFILHIQYHGCWYPGDTRTLGIDSYGNDLVPP